MYEVIVVNDASTDDTAAILQALEQQYDNLWDVTISPGAERTLKGKKFALSKGLGVASHEALLLTDADCCPSSEYWLQNMVAPLASGKSIVVGYGSYNKAAGLLNAWTRWETMHSFMQYSTYTLSGMPYMAVGRNMACNKGLFLRVRESELWNILPSGDDDLLMALAATPQNTALVYNADSYTSTDAKSSWIDWLGQKQRHMSTGKYYKPSVKVLLSVYAFSHSLTWLSFFILAAAGFLKWTLVLMLLRCLLSWLAWALTAARLREKSLILLFPFFDIGWLLYNFALSPYIIFKNKNRWT